MKLSWISRPLDRLPYLSLGVGLFAVKFALDQAISTAWGQPFHLMYYVSPIDAPLFKPGGRMGYYLSMWAGALPFIGIGLWLTVRRLIDARLSGWLLLLFFVPFPT